MKRDLWVYSSFLLGFGQIFRDIPLLFNIYSSVAQWLGFKEDILNLIRILHGTIFKRLIIWWKIVGKFYKTQDRHGRYTGYGVYQYFFLFSWEGYGNYIKHLLYLTVGLVLSAGWVPAVEYAIKVNNKEWSWMANDCKENEFFDDGACYSCPDFCEICTSDSTCTRCQSGKVLRSGSCRSCATGFEAEDN